MTLKDKLNKIYSTLDSNKVYQFIDPIHNKHQSMNGYTLLAWVSNFLLYNMENRVYILRVLNSVLRTDKKWDKIN